MGRKALLKPKYSRAKRRWILSIPPRLSPTGKRKRFAYKTEAEAVDHADRITDARERFRELATTATPDLVATAIEFSQVALELGFRSLRHFCQEAVYRVEAGRSSPPFGEVLDAFEADRSHRWSDAYTSKRWKPFRTRLLEVEDLPTATLGGDFWRQWFAEWREAEAPAPSTYNQQRGLLRSCFGHPIARAFHPANPLDDVAEMKAVRTAVDVFTADQVRSVLETAWRHDRELVPFFAVAFFAGLRPDSEARRCRFDWFKWDSGELAVKVSKTADVARFVEIAPALRAWLAPWARMRGPICPKNFRRRFRQVVRGFYTTPGATLGDPEKWITLVPWSHDVTRHTYGSMFESAHRSEANCRERLAANMGHTSYRTFWSNYRHALPVEEGAAFWAILPPSEEAQAIGRTG